MELYISKPIEESLVNVRDLRFIRSTSQDSMSIVTLEFAYGTDMRRAYNDVLTLMNVIQANLPPTGANLKPSWVVPIDPLNLPILTFGLTGDPRYGWDMKRLREFADNTVVNRLKAVPVFSPFTPSVATSANCKLRLTETNLLPMVFPSWTSLTLSIASAQPNLLVG